MLVSKPAGKYGKKRIYMAGLFICALAPFLMLLDVRSIVIPVITYLFNGIGNGLISPLNYSWN